MYNYRGRGVQETFGSHFSQKSNVPYKKQGRSPKLPQLDHSLRVHSCASMLNNICFESMSAARMSLYSISKHWGYPYLSFKHLWHLDPPYALDTVFFGFESFFSLMGLTAGIWRETSSNGIEVQGNAWYSLPCTKYMMSEVL